jgi:hypothetical protein
MLKNVRYDGDVERSPRNLEQVVNRVIRAVNDIA